MQIDDLLHAGRSTHRHVEEEQHRPALIVRQGDALAGRRGQLERRGEITDGQAVLFPRLTYFEVLEKSLRVMDSTAITMAMEQHIPIIVFKMLQPGNMKRVVFGEEVGTIVETHGDER